MQYSLRNRLSCKLVTFLECADLSAYQESFVPGCVDNKSQETNRYTKTRQASPFHARQCKTKGQACEDTARREYLPKQSVRTHNKTPATVRVHEMFVKIPCSQASGQNTLLASVPRPAPLPQLCPRTGIACHSARTVIELDGTNRDLRFGRQLSPMDLHCAGAS
jgi:hypothetical protein